MELTLKDAFALAARHEAAGRGAEARAIYEQILGAVPEHPGALLRIAEQEAAAGRHDSALATLTRALAAAQAQGLPAQEIWLSVARVRFARAEVEPAHAALAQVHGIAARLKAAGATAMACQALEQCVALLPEAADLRLSLGAVLLDAGRAVAARTHLERAAALGADSAELWDNLGLAQRRLGEDEEALRAFERAAAIAPTLTPALANGVYARYTLCAWDGLEAREQQLAATLERADSDPRWPPWIALAMPTTPAQQLALARRWAAAMLPPVAPRRPAPPRGARLRIGYLSGNFRDHPTGRLMAGLLECHDRAAFEVYGYSYGPAQDAVTERIRAAVEHWRDVAEQSDAQAARLIGDDGIDILIDRHGYTLGSRLAILASRPAPVQLHYMSFPGTLGYDAIDGVIADAEVIPPADDGFFHERVWRLPRCYYVNDSRRGLPAPTARATHQLPQDALVLACLNQSYKLRRPLFATWLAALAARRDAVLWLLAGHPRMQANLRLEAERAGVAPGRLIFAPVLSQDAHIARLACADLSLDTLPYGAHTTACDALWAGVPMLTCRGPTFAGRVGATLLRASGLPELIAESAEAYRAQLLELVAKPQRLHAYRLHLEATRATNPLFDTPAFTRDWEALLRRIYDAVQAGARTPR